MTNRKAIIMMGLPLAGKTSWIKNNLNTYPNGVNPIVPENQYLMISADEIKESHPKYNPNKAYELHTYSVKEAENLVYQTIKKGSNFVFDSGSINREYTIRILNKIIDYGYHIELVHIKTPYEICLKRNEVRERKVPVDNIIEKAVTEIAQFEKLKTLVHKVTVVDYFSNKNIFVDMDGVIAAISTLPTFNGEIDFVNGEIFTHLKPVTPIINKLNDLIFLGYNLYILSATPTSISYVEKNEWLDINFQIDKNKRFFVNRGMHKSEMLEGLVKKLKLKKSDVLMLDDTQSILYDVKKREMNSMHVSEFLIHEFKDLKQK